MRIVRKSEPSAIGWNNVDYDAGIAGWLPLTNYALGDRVFHTDTTGFTNIYESAQAANTGHEPPDAAWWTYVSASNPYRMFDDVSGTQTTADDWFTTSFFATPFANTVALLNISGASVTVSIEVDSVEVFSETQSLLIAGDGVTDWYEYFFGDVGRRHDVLFTGLPSYADQVIEVIVEDTGNTVAIGTIAVGYGYFMGDTLYGLGLGITDYSRKTANDFGGFDIVERPYSKKMSASVRIPNARITEITTLLADYRATPVVIIGADDYDATFVYGFIKDWRLTIPYPSHSIYTIEIEGLA